MKTKNPAIITGKMTMLEIVHICPEAADIMYQYGMHCIGCHISSFETLEEGARMHGLTKRDVVELLREINEANSQKSPAIGGAGIKSKKEKTGRAITKHRATEKRKRAP